MLLQYTLKQLCELGIFLVTKMKSLVEQYCGEGGTEQRAEIKNITGNQGRIGGYSSI